MSKKYEVERYEDTDIVHKIKITEKKSVVTEVNVMDLIREAERNNQILENIQSRNEEIKSILKEINDNTEVKMSDIPEAENILN